MNAQDRLLRYVVVNTESKENADQTPSTSCQMAFAKLLAEEMRELGLSDVYTDEHAYVYGVLPATAGKENCPCVGWIAHLDTVDELGVQPIHPRVVKDYDGGAVQLGTSGRELTPEQFPDLKNAIGKTLITTDGTSILGADDKAGIAAIITACEWLQQEDIPHGRIAICFTPDEEIGHGASLLDLERFGASVAYTVDGSAPWEVEYETFNAAKAEWNITGVSVHPGEAKGRMVNALLVGMEINSMLPKEEIPAKTEGYEGFYHLCGMSGGVDAAQLSYILRDHDANKLKQKKQRMREIERKINQTYGEGTATLRLQDQYRNMAEIIAQHPEVVERANAAIRQAGMKPVSNPVRGGTDGSQLSFRGLPCPNLGTGAYALHGPYEHVIVEQLHAVVQMLVYLAEEYAQDGDN